MKTTYLAIGSVAVASALAGAVAATSLFNPRPARAQDLGPEVTGGTVPYVSFTGRAESAGEGGTIYTVPDDRVLIVTAAVMNSTGCDLLENGVLKVRGDAGAMIGETVLTTGRGRVPFAPGSTVEFSSTDASLTCLYFVQGYLAQP